ncbi:phosphoribosyl 1,2-cyclic phosphodiesterase [Aureimonas endophytica]|uniref:Phosphoribosyl 1,2-cyclic phosphodiesterase n=1 Tax=Aureimonas endophytica TaxID=2027858 RepID=A0A916ZD38_9HYPH|nr:MBL fold metallo-hydrolase [Aureimonas endophytica]GGD89108.1 phosphoribosyl 1,2-cyclic phosphodiesterase [Aureimonas endophytica]
MSDRLRLTILGCGSSPGTPRITGDWGACDPTNPRNRRLRASALVQRVSAQGETNVLIDCGPDLRAQIIASGIRHLDAVLVTHPHADHIHGIDDLRGFALDQRRIIPIHADDATYDRMFEAFRYCFERAPGSSYDPIVTRQAIMESQGFAIEGAGGRLDILPFRQIHGAIHSLGFRFGPLAYCSDVSDFPQGAIRALGGCRHIVIDALQYRPHPSHLSLDQALGWIERLGVESATLTHMHTPLDYETLLGELPRHVRPAFDGMVLEFDLT